MSLGSLLDEGSRFDAEYRGGLSNHLPMALTALQRLGADDVRLATFARTYAARLQPAPADVTWPPGDAWPGRFGDRDAWPAYRALFNEWMVFEGATDVLKLVDAERIYADVRREALSLAIDAYVAAIEARFAIAQEDIP